MIYPRICLNCERPLNPERLEAICLGCTAELSETGYWTMTENAMTDRLRAALAPSPTPAHPRAAALYFFRQGGVSQQLVHALKYYHRPEIGRTLGEELGRRMRAGGLYADLDAIVPVPIHPDRLRERGYNQAALVAEGLAAALDLPVYGDALRRMRFTSSQTRLSEQERFANVQRNFALGSVDLAGRSVLLVDDVLTTGATLAVCSGLLLEGYTDLRLSVATLMVTER